jgi:hypothetical protein
VIPLGRLPHLRVVPRFATLEPSKSGESASITRCASRGLFGCDQMSDLGPLAGLVRLTTLRLDWCKQVSDLSPLVGLTQLAGVFGNLGAQPGGYSPSRILLANCPS